MAGALKANHSPAVCGSVVELRPMNQDVYGLIPGQATCLVVAVREEALLMILSYY